MKNLILTLLLILTIELSSQKPYPDTLTVAVSSAINPPPPPPPPFLPCPSIFRCNENFICGGDFESAVNVRYYGYFVQQWTPGRDAFIDNSIDIFTKSGTTITIQNWPFSFPNPVTHGPWTSGQTVCGATPSNITTAEGDKFMGMHGLLADPNPASGGLWYSEGITFKLRKELRTGRNYTLKFYARKPRIHSSCLDFNLEVRGSTMPPCSPLGWPGRTPLWAGAAGWNAPCGYQYSLIRSSAMITDTVWQEFTINFTATDNIEHLVLSIPQFNSTCPKDCAPYGYFDDFRLYEDDPLKIASHTIVSCGSTGNITITPAGGQPPYNYTWHDGIATKDRLNVPAGTYHVRVADAQRCDEHLTVVIPNTPPILANPIISHPRCKGSNDGSILLFPTGGAAPYTYVWSGGLPPQFYHYGLSPGTYKVIIKDKNGCTFTDEYDIIDTLQPIDIKTKTVITPYTCGGAKGSIRVRPQGGVKPYNVIWTDGRTDTARTDLLPGRYIVRVMDNNHCDKYDTFTVPRVGIYGNAKIILTPVYHCNTALARVNSIVTQGEAPFTYLWSNGSTQSFADNISTTTKPKVYITYTESTGCINRDSIQLQHYIDIGTGTAYPTSASAVGVSKPFHHITANAFRERFRLHGVFTINQSVTFTKCDILARPGSKILANMNLNLDSTTIRTCVDTLWKGIEVAANAAINMKQSTIEDALYAVESNSQRLDYFDNNIFRNNYLGIFYPPRANTSTVRTSYNTFTNNRFLSTVGNGSIKNAFPGASVNTAGNLQHSVWYIGRAWAGMAICDFRHFYFSNNTFSNMINGALFYNVTDPRSTKNIFENMLFENVPILNGYPNGIGLFVVNDKPEVSAWLIAEGHGKNNAISGFKNCRVGLYTAGNVTIHHLNQTRMTNVYEGVNSLLGNASHIRNTNIQAQHRGIYFLPGSTGSVATAPSFCYDSNQISISGNSNLSNGIEVIYTGGSIGTFAVGSFIYTGIANSTVTMNGRSGYGVMVQNLKRALVNKRFGNQPFVRSNTISLNAPSISLGGINLTRSQNTDVENNFISNSFTSGRTAINTSQTPVGLFPVGIYMNMSQDTLRCNSMMNLRTGMRFTGTCVSTNLERNKFYNHTTGLKLDDRSTLKPQINTGNTWLGSYSGGRAAENSQTPMISRFLINTFAPAKFLPTSYSPLAFFTRNSGADNDACTGVIGNGSGSGSGSGVSSWSGNGLKDIILQGGLAFESYETPLIYQNEAELYEELKPLEDILPDTSDELAFLHQLDTGSIGAFYLIEQKEQSYGQLSSADSSLLATAGYLRDSLERQLSYYDAIRASYDDTLVDLMPDTLRSTIDTNMALLLDQISPIRGQLDEYHAIAYTRLQLQCDTLLQMVSQVEAIDTPSRLKKRFLSLYYRTIGRGQRQLDSMQIDSFRQLAQLCPLLEPDAVYRSRAVMRLYEDTIFYDDALICNASGIEYKSTKQPKAKPQITCTLAPNPARDITYLEFSSMPLEPLTIMVSDIQGRHVYSETLTLDSKRYEIKSNKWINGIYLVRVIHKNLGIFDGKLKVEKD